jgi:hypothetical protein
VTLPDIASIALAAVALTLAVCLVAFHFYLRSYRRTLAAVREQRGRWCAEARQLRADRPTVHRRLAEHAAQAVALTGPIPYQLADPTAYMPVWTSDGPAMQEYVQLRDASRRARRVTR